MKQNFTHYLAALILLFTAKPVISQTADFTYSTSTPYCTPYIMAFTANCSGNPVAYVWNFGNRQRGINSFERVVYDSAGTYTVVLTAVYATTAVTVSKTITINPTPAVMLSADKSNLCAPGLVRFTAEASSAANTFEWNFGDESPLQVSESGNISYTYRNYGTFNASVKAITSVGCNNTASYSINISKFGITATVIPINGCIPASATLGVSATLPEGDRVSNYTWSFGDGASSVNGTDSSIIHTYNTTDSITNAKVIITTAGGCSNELTFQSFAFGTPPVNTTMRTEIAKDTFCGSETIKFFANALNSNLYLWEFGDSTNMSFTDSWATYKYRSLGEKNVVVIPSFNGCAGERDSMLIYIKGVIANYSYSNLCGNKNVYQFANGSLGNISRYHWNFSDNATVSDSVNFDPAHTFPPYGSFKSTLFLYDSITGCSDETAYNIYTAVPVLNRNVNVVCKDSLVTYNVQRSYPDSAGYSYEFYVAGDSVSNGKDSVLNYNPSKHGSFADYVVIKDGLAGTCDDTLKLSNITVRGPVVSFTTQERVCTGKAFIFDNSSYPYYAADAITKWEWNFGDSTKSEVKNAEPHIYQLAGFYTISLKATDVNGCSQTFSTDRLSDRLPQIIAFPAMDTICRGRDTAILTAYTIDTLSWLPATSISCTSCDTTSVYPLTTTYYIAKAKNWIGCLSYDTCYIKVYSPLQLKITPADTSVCPGQSINYALNINDGITSWVPSGYLSNTSISNPVATPGADTTFTATVQDSAGCFSDTATASVHLYVPPVVNAGEDQLLPFNTSFTITPSFTGNIASYSWTPAASLTCNNCPTPSGIALNNTTYMIEVVSNEGCRSSDKITIAIQCEKSNLQMPTAFTPNGDGKNEYFYPIARGYKSIRKFVIFNRTGNKVFEKENFEPNNPAAGWNGIIKGAETTSSTETFVWFIEAECQQGEIITSKGSVVLLR